LSPCPFLSSRYHLRLPRGHWNSWTGFFAFLRFGICVFLNLTRPFRMLHSPFSSPPPHQPFPAPLHLSVCYLRFFCFTRGILFFLRVILVLVFFPMEIFFFLYSVVLGLQCYTYPFTPLHIPSSPPPMTECPVVSNFWDGTPSSYFPFETLLPINLEFLFSFLLRILLHPPLF